MNEYFGSLNENNLTENKSTKKDTIVESNFYKENELLFLKNFISENKIPKIFGFKANKNQSCLLGEYKENRKIDILKYKFYSKYSVFYQFKNCLDLFSQLNLNEDNSNILDERFTEFIEALFYSHVNISFKPSFNSIKLIIIGELNDKYLYRYNLINNEKAQFVYKFHDISFILSLDYYYCGRNVGTRLVKIKLKINFPEKYKYCSYFTSFIEKYINKYLLKKYDCNSIFIDILSKRQKLVFIYELKKKYNLSIFIAIINQFIKPDIDNTNKEDSKRKRNLVLKKKSFNDKQKVKELNNNTIIRVYDSGNQMFENIEIKKIEEFQRSPLFNDFEEILKNNTIIRIYDSGNQFFDNIEIKKIEEFQRTPLFNEYEEF